MRSAFTLVFTILLLLTHAEALAAGEGRLIVLNKSEASASILDLASGEEIARVPTGEGPHEVAVAPDNTFAVVADYGARTPGQTLTVIDLVAHSVSRTIDLGEHRRPHGILFVDGHRVLVTTEDSQHLLVVDVVAGVIESAMETAGRVGHMVAVTTDFARAFVPNMYSDTLACFDLGTRERIGLVELGVQPEGVDVRPHHPEVWVTNRGGDNVSIVDADSLTVVATLPCGQFPIRLKFTPDGRFALVSNARSGDVAVFDANTREEIHRIPMLAEAIADTDARLFGDRFAESPVPVGIVVHPSGKWAYVANTNADVVSVLDLETWTLAGRLVAGKEPDGMAWAPPLP